MRKGIILFLITVLFVTGISAQFTPGNIVVSRVGDGSTALSTDATQVQLVEYTTTGIPTGVIITLPTTSGGAGNRACTNSGTASSEGFLSLSYDGRYLVHVGYDATVGVASPQTSTSDYNRTVARIDIAGNVNTSTSFSSNPTDGVAYGRDRIRSVCSLDGTQFWTAGNSASSPVAYNNSGGVRYISFGQDNVPGIQISNALNNTRVVQIFKEQLYVSTQSGTSIRIGSVGSGLPITSGQTISNLPANFPTNTTGPYSYMFFDRSPIVAGIDLVYFVSQTPTGNEYGLFKYSFDGASWTARGKLADVITSNSQAIGLTGYLNCSGNPVLFLTRATNSTSTAPEIRTFTDLAAYDANITNDGISLLSGTTLLASAGSNYAFRGIAMSPAQGYNVTGIQAVAAGNYNVIRIKPGGTAVLTGNIVAYDKIIVENGGTLDMAGFTISSPSGIGSSFEVQSGGKIIIGSPDGITASAAQGNVQTCFRKYAAGAIYEYNSSATQVTGNGLPAILTGTLTINNTSSGVTLTQSTSISGTLNLTAGNLITTASSLLTMENGSNTINASASSFVDGPLKKIGNTDFTFPIGKGGFYTPIGLSGGSGASLADAFTAEYVRTNPQLIHGSCPLYCDPSLNHISYVEYWKLTRDAGTATKQVSLNVHEYSFSKKLNKTYISRWDNTTSKWTNETTTSPVPVACGTLLECGTIYTTNSVTEFGDFTLATDEPFASNPLPIKLTRFDAVKLSASRAMVSWELAACCSKEARFELEKSTDGRNYILLTTLAGSESSKQYSYTDNQLTAGTTWYRLKATDADGKITYSRVATIVNDDSGGLVVTLSPNPAGEQAVVSVTAAKKAMVQFSIISSSGVVMKQWQQAVAAGTQTAAADISALPSGIYQLLCQSEAERVVVRFVKN